MASSDWDDLVGHLAFSTRMDRQVARRVVEEVVAYFAETTEGFVRRRHRELLASGLGNTEAFDRIAAELTSRRVAPPDLSLRQLRRIVYG